jgi:hypothetical protein
MFVAVKQTKLTVGTGTRETHTALLTLMPFQMHTVRGAKNCYRAAKPAGGIKVGLIIFIHQLMQLYIYYQITKTLKNKKNN